ncbi:MAG: 3-deoxy-8-phosphooctulonate synthase, partial [Bacteroidetes bacterium]|nr:3-deoxy-8-phosphooctulonate synthase [Bacteroidota bacterium]
FNPAEAKSDGANMLDLKNLAGLMRRLVALRQTVNKFTDLT